MEATQAETPARLVDESGRIAGDLLCIHCGYNLRTMHESAVCPECGGDVRASIKCCLSVAGEWLGKTATSVKAFAGMLAVEAGLIGVVLLGAIGGPEVLAEAGLISGLIGLFLLLILVLALIMMTPRDPRLRGVREGLSARRGIRLLMLVSLVGLPFSPGSLYLPEGLTLRSALPEVGLSEAVELAGGLVALLPLALLPPTVVRHVANLMKGIGRTDLATRARRLVWVTLAGEAAVVVSTVAGPTVDALVALGVLGFVGGPVVLMFFRAGSALGEAHERARAFAAEPSGQGESATSSGVADKEHIVQNERSDD